MLRTASTSAASLVRAQTAAASLSRQSPSWTAASSSSSRHAGPSQIQHPASSSSSTSYFSSTPLSRQDARESGKNRDGNDRDVAAEQRSTPTPRRSRAAVGQELEESSSARLQQMTEQDPSLPEGDVQKSSLTELPLPRSHAQKEQNTWEDPNPGDDPIPQPAAVFTSATRYADELNEMPLPWLSRPLGVPEKPTIGPVNMTAEETKDYWLNVARPAQRKAIIKQQSTSSWNDIYYMRSHGGKTWRAPNTMIIQDRALWFPAIEGKCLEDRSKKNTLEMLPGKVSIVCIENTVIAEQHTKSFTDATAAKYESNPHFQIVRLNLQPNILKRYLVSLFMSRLRQSVPPSQHKTYLLSSFDIDSLNFDKGSFHRYELGLANTNVGYTYLVGPDGKIRWAGCAFAEKEEWQALMTCTGLLLSRMGGAGAGGAGGAGGAKAEAKDQ